jgi:hypothetical protein
MKTCAPRNIRKRGPQMGPEWTEWARIAGDFGAHRLLQGYFRKR